MSAFDNITKKIAQKNEELAELKKTYMKELQGEFNEIIKLFFEECPKVQAVVWSQYTPYFNDGDECVFSLNDPYFVVDGFDSDDLKDPYEYEDDDKYRTLLYNGYQTLSDQLVYYKKKLEEPNLSDWDKGYYPNYIAKIEKQFVEFPGYEAKLEAFAALLSANEEMLQKVYGDHVAVYLTPEKDIVEEYSHD
jgi:hypothetical protein